MRKNIISFTFAILLIGFVAGCVSENNKDNEAEDSGIEVNENGFPIVDEELELTLMAAGTGLAEWEDMPTHQEYEDKTNITFDYKTSPMDDFGTKLNLAFASEYLPDIIFAAGSEDFTAAMEMEYGEQGLLLPLEDLIEDYAPNLH